MEGQDQQAPVNENAELFRQIFAKLEEIGLNNENALQEIRGQMQGMRETTDSLSNKMENLSMRCSLDAAQQEIEDRVINPTATADNSTPTTSSVTCTKPLTVCSTTQTVSQPITAPVSCTSHYTGIWKNLADERSIEFQGRVGEDAELEADAAEIASGHLNIVPNAHSTMPLYAYPTPLTIPGYSVAAIQNQHPVHRRISEFVARPDNPPVPTNAQYAPPKQLVPPMEYDGKVPWSRYEIHFSAVAKVNEWTADQKALYLVAYLRGPALTYLETLPQDARLNYQTMCDTFRTRFGPECHQSIAHIQLRTRTQKNGENLAEYATDLQRLTFLTFADCPEGARDRIAMEQFLDGIWDLDVQERVRDSAPNTLREALQTATRIEASHRATRASRRNVRAAVASASPVSEDELRPNSRPQNMRAAVASRSPSREEASTSSHGTRRNRRRRSSQPSGNDNELPR